MYLHGELVLADSLYGESASNFISVLDELQLNFVMSIRSSHKVLMAKGQKVLRNRWRKFERVFTNGKTQER